MRRPIVGPAPAASSVSELLRRSGVLGVLPTGVQAYNCYPNLAAPATVTAGAGADTDGLAATPVGAAAIAQRYYWTHVAWRPSASTDAQNRLKIADGGVTKRTLHIASNTLNASSVGGVGVRSIPPYPCTPGAATTMLLASGAGSNAILAYLGVMLGRPITTPPIGPIRTNTYPSVSGLTTVSVTPDAVAWTLGASFTTVLANAANPLLMVGVAIDATATVTVSTQVAIYTGSGGNEVLLGMWGNPGCQSTGAGFDTVYYSLLPFPILIPVGARITAKGAASTGAAAFKVGVDFVSL